MSKESQSKGNLEPLFRGKNNAEGEGEGEGGAGELPLKTTINFQASTNRTSLSVTNVIIIIVYGKHNFTYSDTK